MITKSQLQQARKVTKQPAKQEDIPLATKAGWYATAGILNVFKGVKTVANGIIDTGKHIAEGAQARFNNQ